MNNDDLRHLHQALDAMRQAEGVRATAGLVRQCAKKTAGVHERKTARRMTWVPGMGDVLALEVLAAYGWHLLEREEG